MVVYPHAKINIGLWVTAKRDDGFHDVETLFYPVSLSDSLQIELGGLSRPAFVCNDPCIAVGDANLCCKAYHLLDADFDLPAVRIVLNKAIPVGAGLGGGSSDAAFTLTALNDLCGLGLTSDALERYAARLGSDCAFFVRSKAAIGQGRGEILTPADLSLSQYTILLVKPELSVSTAAAYVAITPMKRSERLIDLLRQPVETWRATIVNDFEPSVFANVPEIGQIKQRMYDMGAVYASMSGSGSAVFGLFSELPDKAADAFAGCFVWSGQG